jgi:GxxExxY protein
MAKSRDNLSYLIIGCAIAVHKKLGPGLVESVYEECLETSMTECGLMVSRQPSVKVVYDGTLLDRNFRPDFIIEGSIVVEVKSVQKILPVHVAQGLTYLKLTGLELGLIINFNTTQLIKGIRRLILSNQPPVVRSSVLL